MRDPQTFDYEDEEFDREEFDDYDVSDIPVRGEREQELVSYERDLDRQMEGRF